MTTSAVNLDTTQYVKVNKGLNPLILQSLRDAVRVTVSDVKPARSNGVYHLLSGDDEPMTLPGTDADVWVLAVSDDASLIVTEFESSPVELNYITNAVVNHHIHQETGVFTTVAVDSAVNDYQIELASVTGFAVGDLVKINTTNEERNHPQIKAINGNVVDFDRRMDYPHVIGDRVDKVISSMNVAGTVATPQVFKAEPPAGQTWYITRLLFAMVHDTAADLGLFGNLPALANGVLLRLKINGQYITLTNWKINADMKTDMFDIEFDTRSGGQGSYGTSGRGNFLGTNSVIKLDSSTNDSFEVHIQDDLTGLNYFEMKVQGHIER